MISVLNIENVNHFLDAIVAEFDLLDPAARTTRVLEVAELGFSIDGGER